MTRSGEEAAKLLEEFNSHGFQGRHADRGHRGGRDLRGTDLGHSGRAVLVCHDSRPEARMGKHPGHLAQNAS